MREGIYVKSYGSYLFPSTIQNIEEMSGQNIESLTKAEIDSYINFIYGE